MDIWLPGMEQRRERFRCLVCQKPFYDGEERTYERHVAHCSEQNAEELNSKSLRKKLPAWYGPEAGDPELEAWVKNNKKPILEGRLKM